MSFTILSQCFAYLFFECLDLGSVVKFGVWCLVSGVWCLVFVVWGLWGFGRRL